jgi:hypothetical protein
MSLLPIIEFPTYKVTLPTTETVLNIRPMIQKDEKILLIAKESSDPSDILDAIKQVVNNCIVSVTMPDNAAFTKDPFNIDALPIIDLEYAFIRLRSVSIGNKSKVAYVDGEDGETREFDVDLDKVTVVDINKLQSIIINDNVYLELRYPPSSLYSDKDFLHAKGQEVVDGLIASVVEIVVNRGDKILADSLPKEELKNFLQTLPVPKYNELTDAVAKLPHLEYKIEYKNNKGNDRTITLSSLNDFFTFV